MTIVAKNDYCDIRVSSTIRALSSACTDARLYSLPIKIGTRKTSACDAQIMLVLLNSPLTQ